MSWLDRLLSSPEPPPKTYVKPPPTVDEQSKLRRVDSATPLRPVVGRCEQHGCIRDTDGDCIYGCDEEDE